MAVKVLADVKYSDVFAALGRFIEEKQMQDICVMEFEDGIILSGAVVFAGREGERRSIETVVLSSKELSALLGSKKPPKRGFFRR